MNTSDYNVYRWYLPATGTYSRPDPINLGILESVSRPQELPVGAVEAYYLAMLRAGNPLHEQPYLYGVQNPLLFYDPLGLFGPGALATAGGACVAIDGPVPVGDIVGVPLLIAAGVWAGGQIIADFWDNREPCDDCDKKDRGFCEVARDACLENRRQPDWNRPLFGPVKDCGACYRECRNGGGLWPYYKCPA